VGTFLLGGGIEKLFSRNEQALGKIKTVPVPIQTPARFGYNWID